MFLYVGKYTAFPSHSLVDLPAQRYMSIKQPWLHHRANSLPPNKAKNPQWV